MANSVRIVHCPKGGKVPLGYCQVSCLNAPMEIKNGLRKRGGESPFKGTGKTWQRLFEEEITDFPKNVCIGLL